MSALLPCSSSFTCHWSEFEIEGEVGFPVVTLQLQVDFDLLVAVAALGDVTLQGVSPGDAGLGNHTPKHHPLQV